MYRGGTNRVVDTQDSHSYIFRSLAEWGGGISVLSTLYICSLDF